MPLLGKSHPVLLLSVCVALSLADSKAGADERARDKKINDYTKYVVRHYGNANVGEELLARNKNVSCLKCHAIDGDEKNAPNMRGVADKFSREDLVRHILDPSLTILPGFETTSFLMEDGRALSGNLRGVTSETYTVWDVEGKPNTIRRDQVLEQRVSTKSLMPDNLIDHISREQLSDLIAFVESLRTTRRKGLVGRETEVNIQKLSEPLQFRPFHAKSLAFDRPVWFEPIPGFSNQFVVLEHQSARVWRLIKSDDGDKKELFLDLKSEVSHGPNEGLMCIAFHTDYVKNGRYFLKHENRSGGNLETRVIERMAAANRLVDSGADSRQLFSVDQPAGNHNGGCIRFGPDGFLYIAFGDGGPQKDPNGNAQSLHRLLGSMMRIDVNTRSEGLPYGIPSDNPLVAKSSRDSKLRSEIWATGFREPWRFSFDSLTGELWVGDVGQVKYEEVTIVRGGENHGWNVLEGFEPFSEQYEKPDVDYTPPVFAYSHSLGASVTGGHVYRGDSQSSFYGMYVFGDFESRRVWGIRQQDRKLTKILELGRSPIAMSAFGIDHEGELYMVGFDGIIYELDFSNREF